MNIFNKHEICINIYYSYFLIGICFSVFNGVSYGLISSLRIIYLLDLTSIKNLFEFVYSYRFLYIMRIKWKYYIAFHWNKTVQATVHSYLLLLSYWLQPRIYLIDIVRWVQKVIVSMIKSFDINILRHTLNFVET